VKPRRLHHRLGLSDKHKAPLPRERLAEQPFVWNAFTGRFVVGDWSGACRTWHRSVERRWPGMTDRKLLEQCATHFEFLRRLAISGGPILQNGIRVPKWHVVACKAARDKLCAHLAETKAERSQSIPKPNRRR
jgi:hypothetical protein